MTLPGLAADGETFDVQESCVLVTILDGADVAAGGLSADGPLKKGRVETYEVTGVTPSVSSVASLWRVTTLNAPDVPVTIRSSAGATVLRTVTEIQLVPPHGLPGATTWHSGFEAWVGDSNPVLPSAPSS